MRTAAGLLFTFSLLAQTTAPTTTVRGLLLEWEGSAEAGQFSLRARDYHVFVFLSDAVTVFERDGQRISLAGLRQGDDLEVIADPGPETSRRHARTVRVLASSPPRRTPLYQGGLRTYHSPTDWLFPRGNITVAGLVLRIGEDNVRVRTRSQGEQTILLRRDTRYLRDGSRASLADLKVNRWVFIRAGKTFENNLEAYQVVWGEILLPR